MEEKNLNVAEEVTETGAEKEEMFEEVEEVVTASWTGCANCCN